jgi:RNA polymerase sigma-70 factor (ECF subfamily)
MSDAARDHRTSERGRAPGAPATAARAAIPSDADLVARVLAGELDCYEVLVRRYQDRLFRMAFGMVLDADTAADLVQDAFVRAYTNLARCRDPARFRVWLYTTLRHRAVDYLREKRRADVSLDTAPPGSLDRALATGGDHAERYALRTALETALAELTPPLRDAFMLRHVEELSVAEVAEVLDVTESAVKMRVHRAREQLRDWFEYDGRPVRGRVDTPSTIDRSM